MLILLLITDLPGMGDIESDARASIGLVPGLGLFGTGLAYIAYYYIVRKLGAITASSLTYIPLVIALLISALLVGEKIELSAYLSTLLIFIGVWLLNRDPRKG